MTRMRESARARGGPQQHYAITPSPAHVELKRPYVAAAAVVSAGRSLCVYFGGEEGGGGVKGRLPPRSAVGRVRKARRRPAIERRRAYQETHAAVFTAAAGGFKGAPLAYRSLPYLQCGQFKGVHISCVAAACCCVAF